MGLGVRELRWPCSPAVTPRHLAGQEVSADAVGPGAGAAGDPAAAPHSGVKACGRGDTQPPATLPSPTNPQHQAAHACLCLYLLKSSQEGPQGLDQMAPFAAAGEPGHRAGHPGGTDLVGWAQAAAGAQREVARQHWTSGHKISWASGCPVPPSPGEPLTVPAHSGHLRWLNWGEEGFLEEVTRNRGPLMGWPLAPGQQQPPVLFPILPTLGDKLRSQSRSQPPELGAWLLPSEDMGPTRGAGRLPWASWGLLDQS